MKRLFLGVMASEKLRSQAGDWAKVKSDWPVRFLAPRNLHLTLIPPYYEKDAEAATGKLAPVAASTGRLFFRYQSIEYGPNRREPRLIWAVGQAMPELADLQHALSRVFGTELERREFLPHLTLARFRPEIFRSLPAGELPEQIDWPEEIRSFELIESILVPAGAEYTVLKSFPLA